MRNFFVGFKFELDEIKNIGNGMKRIVFKSLDTYNEMESLKSIPLLTLETNFTQEAYEDLEEESKFNDVIIGELSEQGKRELTSFVKTGIHAEQIYEKIPKELREKGITLTEIFEAGLKAYIR